MNCEICNNVLRFCWTDAHGVAQCINCGTPYLIYHYEDNKRVDKPPQILLKQEYIPATKAYWEQNKRVMPGGHSFPGGQELASPEDTRLFIEWLEKHEPSNATQ